jgi:hypothetical protein
MSKDTDPEAGAVRANTGEVLSEFARTDFDVVRITKRAYKGRDYVDVRIFYKPEGEAELRPTKKGVTVPGELLPGLIEALVRAQARLA